MSDEATMRPAYPACAMCKWEGRYSNTDVSCCTKFGYMPTVEARREMCKAEGLGFEQKKTEKGYYLTMYEAIVDSDYDDSRLFKDQRPKT